MSWYDDDDDDDETQGWGPAANADLLNACEAGIAALLAYAREVEGLPMPSVAEVLELLDQADAELRLVPGEDAQWDGELAVARLRSQLASVPSFAVAA